MTSDGWILVSPLLLCLIAYFMVAWGAAISLTARLLNRRQYSLPALTWGRRLRWGWMLTLTGGWFLLWDLPQLAQRVNFSAASDGETARAVAVVMAIVYACLALLIGAALFLVAALEARAMSRSAH